MLAWSVSTVERHTNTVRCMQAVWAWPAVLDYIISYRAYVCGGCQGPGGVLGVVLLRVGAFPTGRARSDQQLASSETHARAPAGCVLASLIFILMAYVFAFWFPPRGHDGGMPTSAKRQSACTRTCLCASSTEARLGPIRVPGRSSSRLDVFLCIPNVRPRSSHTGDAAALRMQIPCAWIYIQI